MVLACSSRKCFKPATESGFVLPRIFFLLYPERVVFHSPGSAQRHPGKSFVPRRGLTRLPPALVQLLRSRKMFPRVREARPWAVEYNPFRVKTGHRRRRVKATLGCGIQPFQGKDRPSASSGQSAYGIRGGAVFHISAASSGVWPQASLRRSPSWRSSCSASAAWWATAGGGEGLCVLLAQVLQAGHGERVLLAEANLHVCCLPFH